MNSHFFNCDWGTSRFRLRLVDSTTQTILAERRTDEGVMTLSSDARGNRSERFRNVLNRHVAAIAEQQQHNLLTVPILISGMASSTLGWKELAYAKLPFSLDGSHLSVVRLGADDSAQTNPTFLFSGVRSERDVMRGEETELIGISALLPDVFEDPAEKWVILPGTHSKHVRIVGNSIVDFHTCLTGELFQVLGQKSSLRHAGGEMTSLEVRSSDAEFSRWTAAFREGVQTSQKHDLISQLFQVRTRQLLQRDDLHQSSGFLSGLLIGSELHALAQRCGGCTSIILAAPAELTTPYSLALSQSAFEQYVRIIDPADVARLSALGQYRALQTLQNTMGP